MNNPPNPQEAADLLIRGSELTETVGDADTGRRKIYLLWAAVMPLAMIGFDLFSEGIGALAMQPFLLIGLAGTFLILRQTKVYDVEAMMSYVIVMVAFAVLWPLLVWVLGPWLGEQFTGGWLVTGLLGSLIFLGGYVWDRSR